MSSIIRKLAYHIVTYMLTTFQSYFKYLIYFYLFILYFELKNEFSYRHEARKPVTSSSVAYPARNPEKVREQSRRETFMYFPHQGLMDIDSLVDAGFFFTG